MWIVKISGRYAERSIKYLTYEEALAGYARAQQKIAFSKSEITIKEV